MASPHYVLPVIHFRSGRVAARVIVFGLAAATTLALLPASAHADPKVNAAAAQAQLQSLSDKAEALVEKFDAVQDQLAAAQHALSADKDGISEAQRSLDATKAQVAAVANAAYESGGTDTLQLLLSSGDPQSALNRAGMLTLLADQRGQQLRIATVARNKLTQAQATANQQLKTISALQASLKSQQKTIDGLVSQQQALLATSQTQIAADNAKAAAAAAAKTAAAAAAVSRAKARVAAPRMKAPAATRAIIPVSAGGRAAAAVKYAYAQLGKPYRWAGAGPRSFDCSGLTMRAWQAAGISLGHNAAGQYRSTQHVSRSQLQPGDLVYFGRPIHHVGIYIGNGQMIEAPYTGADVRITSFGYRTDYAGASRP